MAASSGAVSSVLMNIAFPGPLGAFLSANRGLNSSGTHAGNMLRVLERTAIAILGAYSLQQVITTYSKKHAAAVLVLGTATLSPSAGFTITGSYLLYYAGTKAVAVWSAMSQTSRLTTATWLGVSFAALVAGHCLIQTWDASESGLLDQILFGKVASKNQKPNPQQPLARNSRRNEGARRNEGVGEDAATPVAHDGLHDPAAAQFGTCCHPLAAAQLSVAGSASEAPSLLATGLGSGGNAPLHSALGSSPIAAGVGSPLLSPLSGARGRSSALSAAIPPAESPGGSESDSSDFVDAGRSAGAAGRAARAGRPGR